MQLSFYTTELPESFISPNEDLFPEPTNCLNPACRVLVPPEKHGFYERNIIDAGFAGRIKIRRYYCPYCGMTFSFLPSFCLPYFQYSLALIFFTLCCHFFRLIWVLHIFTQAYQLSLQRQHRQFYARRFSGNLHGIKLILRSLIPSVELPEPSEIRNGAQKVLDIVLTGFPQIQTFSPRFFAQCNHSFMTPCKLF